MYAPLVFRADEGWVYEKVGEDSGKWRRARAKDQLDVAQQLLDKKDYDTAEKAARRVVAQWPASDYAPKAQYLVGRSLEAQHKDEKAFKAYQKVIEKYPKVEQYEEVLSRQYGIANRFLGGQWFKLWGIIPFFPSMDKTSDMYTKIIHNGPYSTVAPDAQMKIGTAREKQRDYTAAVKAYETAADRYNDRPKVAADALYRAGQAYTKSASTAEYDQSAAGQAIATFTDFMTLYPDDPRVPETQKIIGRLKTEQARGNFQIARFYEKRRHWESARIYYNAVLLEDPNSPYAKTARERIDALKKKRNPPRPRANDMWRPLLCLLMLNLCGCAGYKLGPPTGEAPGSRSVQISPFNNMTLEPRLTDAVTSQLRKSLQRDNTFKLATHGDGDIHVTGVITTYRRHELSFAPKDVITVRDYRISIQAQVTAREKATGKLLFDQVVNGSTIIRVGNDLVSSERQALPLLAADLAKNVTDLLVDGSW